MDFFAMSEYDLYNFAVNGMPPPEHYEAWFGDGPQQKKSSSNPSKSGDKKKNTQSKVAGAADNEDKVRDNDTKNKHVGTAAHTKAEKPKADCKVDSQAHQNADVKKEDNTSNSNINTSRGDDHGRELKRHRPEGQKGRK
eukprot:GILI01026623.1.p1 GENE.GILI01026623.1~~GILI01026623.1.p1  ORF type:complete len:139 (+),score=17.46 GILI01026623.1:337-753(+)